MDIWMKPLILDRKHHLVSKSDGQILLRSWFAPYLNDIYQHPKNEWKDPALNGLCGGVW